MNVLSLFNGIGAGREALKKSDIKVTNFYYSEIDKFANQVVGKHYPQDINFGDISNWKDWDLDWSSIDLLLAGSPCQGFSFAGKQLAFDDPRSKLFFVFVDILNHIKTLNPDVKFMLENVRMKKEFIDVISEKLQVEPIVINSALVSAQNRNRLYWANWRITQPQDKSVYLKDIIEKPYIGVLNKTATKTNKAYTLTASYGGAVAWNSVERKQRTMIPTHLSVQDNPNNYDGIFYRKLTPLECERLQTFPDNYTDCCSDSQRYKQLGNSWTVEVIAHILKCM